MFVKLRRIAVITSETRRDADSIADAARGRRASTGGDDVREIRAPEIGALTNVWSFRHRRRAYADADSSWIFTGVAPRAGLPWLFADILLQEGAVTSLFGRVQCSIVRDAEIYGEGRIVEVGDVLRSAPKTRAGEIARRLVSREGTIAGWILRDADAFLNLIAKMALSVH